MNWNPQSVNGVLLIILGTYLVGWPILRYFYENLYFQSIGILCLLMGVFQVTYPELGMYYRGISNFLSKNSLFDLFLSREKKGSSAVSKEKDDNQIFKFFLLFSSKLNQSDRRQILESLSDDFLRRVFLPMSHWFRQVSSSPDAPVDREWVLQQIEQRFDAQPAPPSSQPAGLVWRLIRDRLFANFPLPGQLPTPSAESTRRYQAELALGLSER